MTPGEFFVKYQGQKIDYDKAFGPQCVDVFRQYCQDVIGCRHTGSVEPEGAKGIWFRYSENDEKLFFNRFSASQAKYGDVIIWDASDTNKYGHVAIVVAVHKDQVLVFEQDGFKKDGGKFAVRSLLSALGVLRKKP